MQLLLDDYQAFGSDLFIKVSSGNSAWAWVKRAADGTFECDTSMCHHKREQHCCEHVQFAMEKYPIIAEAIANKTDMQTLRQIQEAKQAQDRANAEAAAAAAAHAKAEAAADAAIGWKRAAIEKEAERNRIMEAEYAANKTLPDESVFEWQSKRRIRMQD